MDSLLIPVLVPAVVSLVVTLLGFFFARSRIKQELRNEFYKIFNKEKWVLYPQFIDILVTVFFPASIGEAWLDNTVNQLKKEWIPKLSLVGSPEVVKAINDWLQAIAELSAMIKDSKISDKDREKVIKDTTSKTFQIILEMRKDLGYQDDNLRTEEIQNMLLK